MGVQSWKCSAVCNLAVCAKIWTRWRGLGAGGGESRWLWLRWGWEGAYEERERVERSWNSKRHEEMPSKGRSRRAKHPSMQAPFHPRQRLFCIFDRLPGFNSLGVPATFEAATMIAQQRKLQPQLGRSQPALVHRKTSAAPMAAPDRRRRSRASHRVLAAAPPPTYTRDFSSKPRLIQVGGQLSAFRKGFENN